MGTFKRFEEFKTLDNTYVLLDTGDACLTFGFRAGDRRFTPLGIDIVAGVGMSPRNADMEPYLWTYLKNGKVICWVGYTEKRFRQAGICVLTKEELRRPEKIMERRNCRKFSNMALQKPVPRYLSYQWNKISARADRASALNRVSVEQEKIAAKILRC